MQACNCGKPAAEDPRSSGMCPDCYQADCEGDHARAMCELERRVDTAYSQRNNAAVALVRMALLLGWPAGRGLDDKTDSAPEWRHVVYLDLPNGEQVSYHMAPADVPLLDGLPEYAGKWDGEFTGTTAWAQMVPAVPMEYWRSLYDEPEFDTAEIDRLMQDVPVDQAVQIVRLDCTAWSKPIYTRPFPGFDLSPTDEAQAGVTRTAEGVTVGGLTFGPDTRVTHFGTETARIVPKEPFKPGVCACPGCEQPRAVGRLFCEPHRSVDGRFRGGPLTNEQLAYMMQRDGEQQ